MLHSLHDVLHDALHDAYCLKFASSTLRTSPKSMQDSHSPSWNTTIRQPLVSAAWLEGHVDAWACLASHLLPLLNRRR